MTRFKAKIGKVWKPQPGKYYSQRYLRIMHKIQVSGGVIPEDVSAVVLPDNDGIYHLIDREEYEQLQREWYEYIHKHFEDRLEKLSTHAEEQINIYLHSDNFKFVFTPIPPITPKILNISL